MTFSVTVMEIKQKKNENRYTGFYPGFIVWGREVPSVRGAGASWRGPGAPPPPAPSRFLQMNVRLDAIWCILRHDFAKCYSVCTGFVACG